MMYTVPETKPGTVTKTTSSKDTSGNRKSSISDKTAYGHSLNYYDDVVIPGAPSINLTIYYSTESCCDYVAVFPKSMTPSTSNVTSSISGKLGGNSSGKTTYEKTYTTTINDDTARIFFHSDGSVNSYGYWAEVSGEGMVITQDLIEGTYVEPTRTDYTFLGWATTQGATTPNFKSGDIISDDTTVYAVWTPDYTLTYNAHGGSGAPAQQKAKPTVVDGAATTASFTVSSTVPTRTNYTFAY